MFSKKRVEGLECECVQQSVGTADLMKGEGQEDKWSWRTGETPGDGWAAIILLESQLSSSSPVGRVILHA